ncbi:MAG: HAD-IIB family hydrolase [Acidobacteria bacterium]|nr:MAG: HAD-IIB family hydrolase [Acidobacteriota bacterium]
MRYYALATDYDGTLAHHGRVDEATLQALERLRSSSRRLILVTGRELDDLSRVFSRLDLFDQVVAENGALLYTPQSREERLLAEKPPEDFVARLRQRGVGPISVGRSVVATWRPHAVTVLQAISELGLELQVIFNKDAVMVLPTGVNKATGLAVALNELGLSRHNVAAIGDAENDHAFLRCCACSAAVANALPTLKERADFVTKGDHGAGVVELIDMMLRDDLQELEPRLTRHHVLLGWTDDERQVGIKPYGESILITGTSGGGKSTMATGLLERLAEQGYQFCIVDPEGDYTTFEKVIVLGDPQRPPNVNEIVKVLEHPEQNVAVNMIGLAIEHRAAFFASLLPHLAEMRTRTGRPHWLVLDETHHLLPASGEASAATLGRDLNGFMFITVHPEHVSKAILSFVDLIIAIGKSPGESIRQTSRCLDEPPPRVPEVELRPGEGLMWRRREGQDPVWFRSEPPRTEMRRHFRKYAEGELEPEKSFYFRGPDRKLNLRAQNLNLFLQIAQGIDDETWMYHLKRGDYSRWLRTALQDEALAAEVEEVERHRKISPKESRELIRASIEERYTAPA